MTTRRWLAALLACLFPLAPVPALAQVALPPAQDAEPAIVVTGGLEEKQSAWRRAEGDHVVVFSDGGEAELVRVTNNLERLHALLSRLYRKGGGADETAKLQVVLFDSAADLRALGLRNRHWEEGPFAPSFAGQRYYDAREDGGVLALARRDQLIKLNTKKAFDQDCDEITADGGSCKDVPYHYPAVRGWEALLYSGYAQHFLLTHAQAVHPRWYVDGVGALFSTLETRGDGSVDYARAPVSYAQVFRSYGPLAAGDVLTGRYLEARPGKGRGMDWTPYHAWLLAHFFSSSKLPRERGRQFRAYLAAVHRGVPLAEAAGVFGDMRRLEREVALHAERPVAFARTDKPLAIGGEPLVTRLSLAGVAALEARLALAAQPEVAWVAGLRARVAKLGFDAEAWLVVAEAECRSGDHAGCLASAERVLARTPEHGRALAWKGVALTGLALAGPAAERSAGLRAARATIERALALDGQAPVGLIARFRSFTAAGEPVPEAAMLGMARVVQQTPAAPGPRLELGTELVRQGKAGVARGVLYPVLHAAEDSPEKRTALALLADSAGQGGR